jgi:hypothetical protein
MVTRGQPTRRQVEVLRAYIRTGSVAAAAHELGIGQTTARQHLSGLYRRTGCLNAAQAAYWLGAGGLTRAQARPSHQSSGPWLPTTSYRRPTCAGSLLPTVRPGKTADE